MIKKIKDYIFEKTEKYKIIKEPFLILSLTKLRKMYPILKKSFLIYFIYEITLIIFLIYFLIFKKPLFNREIYLLSKFFLVISLLKAIISILINTLIIFFIVKKRKKYYRNFSLFYKKMKKLMISRLMKWFIRINKLFHFFNIFQMYYSVISFLFKEKLFILQINFLITFFYISELIYLIRKLNKIGKLKLSDLDINDIINSKKILEFKKDFFFEKCFICFETFNSDKSIIELDCKEKHVFHKKCIKDWYKFKCICPICKTFS